MGDNHKNVDLSADEILSIPTSSEEAIELIDSAIFTIEEDTDGKDGNTTLEDLPSIEDYEVVIDSINTITDINGVAVDDSSNETIIDELMGTNSELVEAPIETGDARKDTEEKIKAYFNLFNIPFLETSLSTIDDENLKEYLYILEKENGGSFDVALKIKETMNDYKQLFNDEKLQRRIGIIDAKSNDYLKVVQRLSSMIGNDVSIKGVKVSEYHAMLTETMKNYSILISKIMKVGEFLNIEIPADENFPTQNKITIIEDLPKDPQIAMFVLNVISSNVDKFVYMGESMRKEIYSLRSTLEFNKSEITNAKNRVNMYEQTVEHLNAQLQKIDNRSVWVIVDKFKNTILRSINKDEDVVSAKQLDLRGTIDFSNISESDAIVFDSKIKATRWAEQIGSTKRFKNRTLTVKKIVIMEDK